MEIKKFHFMICDLTFERTCNLGNHQKTVHDENGKKKQFSLHDL